MNCNANKCIECTVKQCAHHCENENYCSLDRIMVGTHEANPMEARISDESPMGQALMGKRVGEIAEYESMAGTVRFKILDVNR